ncbi:DUF4062 domain-containing protein [Bacillus cereus]|uniref:DUF4062 domain-containing protein n=1 Tax=Bacillus cereus TaxID=1396 RepID=UPI0015CF5A42|nr:DUF4062 domain-containing protein [Bacillus cereus]MED2489852.1 DUF4062 domain-containing protein [Bacillus thuringiensis]
MQYKYSITSNKIKVFLSSSMKDERFRDQRNGIISFLERMPLYDLFAIENLSSNQSIRARYIEEVKNADIIILILQSDLREGVIHEFYAATRSKRRIFAFIHTGRKTKELREFIDREVNTYVTSTQFKDNRDLIDKIEATLLEDLVVKYVRLYEENINLYNQLDRLSKPKGY